MRVTTLRWLVGKDNNDFLSSSNVTTLVIRVTLIFPYISMNDLDHNKRIIKRKS